MPLQTNRERCLAYLNHYAAKDIAAIDDLFADDIVLRDWKIRVVGKTLALEERRKILMQ